MTALPSGVSERTGSPTISITVDGTTAQRVFDVRSWDDWPLLATRLIGGYEYIDGIPFSRPGVPFPGMPHLMVVGIDVAPVNDKDARQDAWPVADLDTYTNRYNIAGCTLTAKYATRFDENNQKPNDPPGVPEVPDGTWLQYQESISSQMLTIPGRAFYWMNLGTTADDLVESDMDIAVPVFGAEIQLTWNYVISPPYSAMEALAGTSVNDDQFLRWGDGKVLYMGSEIDKQFQFLPDGGFFKVTHRFAVSQKKQASGTKVGWNYFWRREAGAAGDYRAIHDGAGNRIFRYEDFSPLFQFE